ncbi:MAG TPA: hypothetical protein VM889_04155 [Candidatus Thermoplasmatota archaeon]|nr:hypothetical protein [Candidatus Thermoplasmatota archaeon]
MQGIQTVQLVYATIENTPGQLSRAASALGRERINIDALSLETQGHLGMLRLLTTRTGEAVKVLRNQGIEAHESEAIAIPLGNRPGELGRVSSELAAAGLNIESVFPTPDGRLVIRTNDVRQSERILGKL